MKKEISDYTNSKCNICGSTEFVYARRSKATQCADCESTERVRVTKMFLDKYNMPRPGMKIAHFAPERGLAKYLESVVGEGYCPYNLNISLYDFVETKAFDLCKDIFNLPSNQFDIIIHNHVLEHLPCNWTMTLIHLHRSLKPNGLHLFSVPVTKNHYQEDLSDIPSDERCKRFGQAGHIRNFGRQSIEQTLGMIFKIQTPYRLDAHFSKDELSASNIRKGGNQHTGASVICLRKSDIRLERELTVKKKKSIFKKIKKFYRKRMSA